MATVGPSRPVNSTGAQSGAGLLGSYQIDPSLVWGSGYYNRFGGSLVPSQMPIFRASDFSYQAPTTSNIEVGTNGDRQDVTDPGGWHLNTSGGFDGDANNMVFSWGDPSTGQTYSGGADRPTSFNFGIKSGRDQGHLMNYTLDPTGQYYIPTGDYGIVGGRHGIFDTNEGTREFNKNAAMIAASALGAYYMAPAGGAEAGNGMAGWGTEGGINGAYTGGGTWEGAGSTVATGAPEYGSPGYDAGTPSTGTPSSVPEYGSPGYNAGNGSGTPSGTTNGGNNPFGNMKGSDWVKLGTTAYGLLGGGNDRGNGSVGSGGMLNYTGAPMRSLGQVMGAAPQYTMPTQPTIDPRTPAAQMYSQYMQGLSQPMGLLNGPAQPQKPAQDPTLLGSPYARPVTRTSPYGN